MIPADRDKRSDQVLIERQGQRPLAVRFLVSKRTERVRPFSAELRLARAITSLSVGISNSSQSHGACSETPSTWLRRTLPARGKPDAEKRRVYFSAPRRPMCTHPEFRGWRRRDLNP